MMSNVTSSRPLWTAVPTFYVGSKMMSIFAFDVKSEVTKQQKLNVHTTLR